uniref:hypothetical protein n=3 Tax=Vibrionaceae TaxID=641 RepID=UPI001A7E13AB
LNAALYFWGIYMNDWTNLTTCFGHSIQNPTDEQLKAALGELYRCNDLEHPDAWIEHGSNEGSLVTLSVFSRGYAIYIKYSDLDMIEELENRRIENVTEEMAFHLWKNIADGNSEQI